MEATRVSECPTCPPWVNRCVHWDGKVLVQHDRIFVCLLPEPAWEGDGQQHVSPALWGELPYDHEFAAEAAFHEAEERLLRGER